MNIGSIKRLIDERGLKPSIERPNCLLFLSFVCLGYTKQLHSKIGYSYKTLVSYGKKDYFYDALNEEEIAEFVSGLLEKHKEKTYDEIIKPIFEEFLITREEFERLSSKKGIEYLRSIIDLYPSYLGCIGVYNCFVRYTRVRGELGLIGERLAEKISKERDEMAKLYVQVERKILKECKRIGRKAGFDGDLIRYTTLVELLRFLKLKKLDLKKLARRREGYFHVYSEKIELVKTKKEEVEELKSHMMKDIKDDIFSKKHTIAYKGHAKGRAFNALGEDISKIDKGDILVSIATHPGDSNYISKAAAIITNEGGILSHAATIARELKIPALIGVKNATKNLKHGMMIEVDAEQGTIKQL